MNIASLVFGLLSVTGMIVAFFPCLGSLNWLNIPFSLVGLGISWMAHKKIEDGQSKTLPLIGLVLCAIAVIFGFFRLVAGGGVV
jgi:hypothetical protein